MAAQPSTRRIFYKKYGLSPTRRPIPTPGPLGSPLLVPLCSFRPDQPFLKFPKFSDYFLFFSFVPRSAFLVSGFWFLVLALLRLISNRFLLRGRVSSEQLQLLTSKRFTALH
jgi:hypothetical protein